ncbi:unnamed protein product [Cylindrotheca closterium]|uniref:Helicase-associated domain-containing protein n=1 Tax=Cylindrotheca closterium TaxID=2856 RepID=A0AAD2G860_9STRA|nr:unnamed protein product [Cylindrotheca closterium]
MDYSDITAPFDLSCHHSSCFQQQLHPDLPRKALNCDFSNTSNSSPVRSDTLQRLPFSDTVSSFSMDFDWASSELSPNDVGTHSSLEHSALEPCPIDEIKMKVLQNRSNGKTQQEHHMKTLLSIIFRPESAKSGPLGHPSTAIMRTHIAGSCSPIDSGAERGLGPFTGNVLLRPIKKQRVMTSAMNKDYSSTTSVLHIAEDSLNQFGRFRDYQSGQWSLRFRELDQFRLLMGHCCVPHGYQANPALARWVKRQRYQYKLRAEGKSSTMTIERISELERLGFVWDSHGEAWMERFNELHEYFLKHGSCNVSSNYTSSCGRQLSSWVKCQRRQYRMYKEGVPSTLSPDRISNLESIGFEWELKLCRNTTSPSSAS